jgi:hypothetical protein
MKKVLLALVAVAMVGWMSETSSAEGKFKISVAGDVLMPMGDFGDAFSTGFGGSVRGELSVAPMISATLETGYFTWSPKDLPAGYDASFYGIPVLAGVKAYFMPAGGPRAYGMAELGLFLATASATVPILGEVSTSETEFGFAPVIGVEIPVGPGTSVDVSARYFSIATDPSSNSIGFRAGISFGVGG